MTRPPATPPRDLFVHPLATASWESLPAVPYLLSTRAAWDPSPPECAPEHRTIHLRAYLAGRPTTFNELVIRSAAGYHKCASGQEIDRARHIVARVPDPAGWRVILDERPDPTACDVRYPLDGLVADGLTVEIREAMTDRWWPGWNLANTGVSLIGSPPDHWNPGTDGSLATAGLDLADLPSGLSARHLNGEVRYQSAHLEVGFRLRSPAWSYFAVDGDGTGRTHTDLLQQPRSMDIVRSGVYPSGVYPVLRDQGSEYLHQGPRFVSHRGVSELSFLTRSHTGSVDVSGNVVHYAVAMPNGLTYSLRFTVTPTGVRLEATRESPVPLRAWYSSAWQVAFATKVTPPHLLGLPLRRGETGLVGPGTSLLHFPRHGTIEIQIDGDAVTRFDTVRPLDTSTWELKVGETPTREGDYLLPAGRHFTSMEWRVVTPATLTPQPDTPTPVARMMTRHSVTALPFRQDTATVSNNGASMHCTGSLLEVAAVCEHLPRLIPSVDPMDWIRLSVERWLDGAPSYGSGATCHGPHLLDDEYVHMAALSLAALARVIRHDRGWFDARRGQVISVVEAMLARDVDGDGLVESTIRLGVTGEHQWSTAWADVISFGWKDAWANAATYDAYSTVSPVLRHYGETELADSIDDAIAMMRQTYLPTFLNPSTGLIGGWRSHDGVLHDYGFSIINGAACRTDLVSIDDGRRIMTRLVDAWSEAGVTDWRNGLPLNLWRVPEDDLGGVVFGLPMGGYQQGGCSHHHARLVVEALERVGMRGTAEQLLVSLAETVADDSAFGGVGSGRDWRMWDGTPSGYEGQLAEGFGILATAWRWYGTDQEARG